MLSRIAMGRNLALQTRTRHAITSEVATNQYTFFDILRIKNGHKQFEKDSIFNKTGQENIYLYNY